MAAQENVQAKVVEYLEKGLRYFGMGNNQEALVYWKEVLSLDPGNLRAKEYLNYIEESAGLADSATDSGVRLTTAEGDIFATAEAATDSLFPEDESVPWEESAPQGEVIGDEDLGLGVSVAPPAPDKDEDSLRIKIEKDEAASTWEPSEGEDGDIYGGDDLPVPGQDEAEERSPSTEDGYEIDPRIKEQVDALMIGAEELLEAADYGGALDLLEKVFEYDPKIPAARRLQAKCRAFLLQWHREMVGELSRVPEMKVSPTEMMEMNLDHKIGFLLSQVDGMTSYEDLLAISGMDELETMGLLARMVNQELIAARES